MIFQLNELVDENLKLIEIQNNISENDKSNQYNKFIQSSLNIKTNNINLIKFIKRKTDNIDNVISKDDKLYNIPENEKFKKKGWLANEDSNLKVISDNNSLTDDLDENFEDKGEKNKNFFTNSTDIENKQKFTIKKKILANIIKIKKKY